MRPLVFVLLAVLATSGCNSPAYEALIKGQEKWATMGTGSSETTADSGAWFTDGGWINWDTVPCDKSAYHLHCLEI